MEIKEKRQNRIFQKSTKFTKSPKEWKYQKKSPADCKKEWLVPRYEICWCLIIGWSCARNWCWFWSIEIVVELKHPVGSTERSFRQPQCDVTLTIRCIFDISSLIQSSPPPPKKKNLYPSPSFDIKLLAPIHSGSGYLCPTHLFFLLTFSAHPVYIRGGKPRSQILSYTG